VHVLPLRVAIAAVVGVVDVLLARRWLERSDATVGLPDGGIRTAGRARGGTSGGPPQPLEPSRDVLFSRLVWQQWRQSRRMMLVIAAAAVPVVGAATWLGMTPPFTDRYCLETITLLFSLLAGLMGACVFFGDQWREQFRFFAEHGARPGYVWLSRQLVWIIPLVLFTTLVVPLFLLLGRDQVFDESWQAHTRLHEFLHERFKIGYLDDAPAAWLSVTLAASHAWYFLLCVAAAYAAGQFCSILFRSGILAVVFGLMLGAALCGWTLLVRLLDINSLWAAAPIPLVLLLATRLRTADWILERKTLGSWLRLGAVVVLPAVAIVAAVPAARVRSIPLPNPMLFSGGYEREPTAEEQATAAMYQRALDLYRPYWDVVPAPPHDEKPDTKEETPVDEKTLVEREDAYVKGNEETIALVLAATRRPLGDISCPPRLEYSPRDHRILASLLLAAARKEQREGRLDQAMERYLATLRLVRYMGYYTPDRFLFGFEERCVYKDVLKWVVAPGQTSERVAALLRQLEELLPTLAPSCNGLKAQYILARGLIELDPAALQAAELDPREVFWLAFSARWLPWEQTRARRLLYYTMDKEVAYCLAVEGHAGEWEQRLMRMELDGIRSGWRRLPISSILPDQYEPRLWQRRHEILRLKTQRAVIQLALGVEAWRLAHGRLPDSLDVLVGPYLKELPVDPASRLPFRYFREGLPFPVVSVSEEHPTRWQTVPAGTPLLASSWLDVTLGESPYRAWDPIRHGFPRPADRWGAGEDNKWYAEPIYPLPQPAKAATAATVPSNERQLSEWRAHQP